MADGTHPDRRARVGRRRHPVRAAGRAAARSVRGRRSSTCSRRAWCAPVYARMRGIGRIIETTTAHGALRPGASARRWRSELARQRLHARDRAAQFVEVRAGARGSRAFRSAPAIVGEARYGLLNDIRAARPARRCRASSTASPRLPCGRANWCRCRRGRCSCPTSRIAPRRCARCGCAPTASRRSCAPAPNTGRPSAGRRRISPSSRRDSWPTACRCGSSARPTTSSRPNPCCRRRAKPRRHMRDLTGRTDLGTAIDLLSLASHRRQQRFRA